MRIAVDLGFEETRGRLVALAEQYHSEVEALRALGDQHPEYHAQHPKVVAYRILLDGGMTPKEAVAHFACLLRKVSQEAT